MTTFWSEKLKEHLIYTTADEAIESILDGMPPEHAFSETREITVYEFGPMKPSASSCGEPLAGVLENLDEEYGDPDGSYEEPTEAMLAAEKAFIAAVLAEYVPWQCEETGNKVTVKALEWVRAHRPDWLTESREGSDRG